MIMSMIVGAVVIYALLAWLYVKGTEEASIAFSSISFFFMSVGVAIVSAYIYGNI